MENEITDTYEARMKALVYICDKPIQFFYENPPSIELIKFFTHEEQINISAIYCAFKSLKKVLDKVQECIDHLHTSDTDEHRKVFLHNVCTLGRFVSF